MNLFTQDNSLGSDQLKLQFQQLCVGSPQQTELKLLLPIFQSLSSWVHVDIAPDSTTPLQPFIDTVQQWLANQGVYDRSDCEILDRLLRSGLCFGKFWLIDLAFPDIKLTFSPTSRLPYLRIGLVLEVAALQGILPESYAHDMFEKVMNDNFDLLELAKILLQILQFSSAITIRNFLSAMKTKHETIKSSKIESKYTNRELLMFNIINNQIDYENFSSEISTKLKNQREEFYNAESDNLPLNNKIRFDPNFPLCFSNGVEYKTIVSTDQTYLLNSLSPDLIANNQSHFPPPPYQFCQQSLATILNQELIILTEEKVVASSILETIMNELPDQDATENVLRIIKEQIHYIITMQQHWTQQQLDTILLNIAGNLLDQRRLTQLIDRFKVTQLVCPLINKIQTYPQLYSQRLQWQLQSLHFDYDPTYQEQLKQEWIIDLNQPREEKALIDLLSKYNALPTPTPTTGSQGTKAQGSTITANPRRSQRLRKKKLLEETSNQKKDNNKEVTWLLNKKMEIEDQIDLLGESSQQEILQDEKQLMELRQELTRLYPQFKKTIDGLSLKQINEGLDATTLSTIDYRTNSIRVVTRWKEQAYREILQKKKAMTVPESFDTIQRINFIDSLFSELKQFYPSAAHLIDIDQMLIFLIDEQYCNKADLQKLIQSNHRSVYPDLLFDRERYSLQEFIYVMKLQLMFFKKKKCSQEEEQEIIKYDEFSEKSLKRVIWVENYFMLEQPLIELKDFKQHFNLYSMEEQGLIRKLRKKEIDKTWIQDVENLENVIIQYSRSKNKSMRREPMTATVVTAISKSINSCLIKAIVFLKYRPKKDFNILLERNYEPLSLIDFIYVFQEEFIFINNIRYIQATTETMTREKMMDKFIKFDGFRSEVKGQLFYWFQITGLSLDEIKEWNFQFKEEYELVLLSNYPNHWIAIVVSDTITIQQDQSYLVMDHVSANTTIVFVRKKIDTKYEAPDLLITNISQEDFCLMERMKMPASILTPAINIIDIKSRIIKQDKNKIIIERQV